MRPFWLVALALLLCAGCAAKKADLYREQMIGQSTVDLLQCAGVPTHQFQHGALLVLNYSYSTPQYVGSSGSGGIAHKVCDASVFIEHDIVTNVAYRSVYGSEACEPIFRACIAGA